MAQAVYLFGICWVLCGTQAFFLAPATTARRVLSKCGTTGPDWSCQYARPEGASTARTRRERRGAGGALTMKKKLKSYLTEVPKELKSKAVALECPTTGGTLVCYAERVAVVQGVRYLVAFPKDPAVAIAFDDEGDVCPVPHEDPIMNKLFPLAKACVAELGPDVTLLRTPTALTVRGLDEAAEARERVHEEMDDDDDDADEVELIGEFLLEGEEFLIVRFLEPILVLAKEHAPGKYMLIDEDEEQFAIPKVEQMLCKDATIMTF